VFERQCPMCASGRAVKTLELTRMPKILAVYFNRFSFAARGLKVSTCVELPQAGVDLSALSAAPEGGVQGGSWYDPYAVINHEGVDLRSGHYTANVMMVDGVWKLFNDRKVSNCKPPGKSRDAYGVLLRLRVAPVGAAPAHAPAFAVQVCPVSRRAFAHIHTRHASPPPSPTPVLAHRRPAYLTRWAWLAHRRLACLGRRA
jgi:hypothetical protein